MIAGATHPNIVERDGERYRNMSAEAQRLAPGLAWTAVARRYRRLADSFAVKQSQAS